MDQPGERWAPAGAASVLAGIAAVARRPFFLVFMLLALIELLQYMADRSAADLAELAVLALLGVAAVNERGQLAVLEAARRAEAEGFTRILRRLSSSVSPDAIVAAIVDELGAASGADHVAVVRR